MQRLKKAEENSPKPVQAICFVCVFAGFGLTFLLQNADSVGNGFFVSLHAVPVNLRLVAFTM